MAAHTASCRNVVPGGSGRTAARDDVSCSKMDHSGTDAAGAAGTAVAASTTAAVAALPAAVPPMPSPASVDTAGSAAVPPEATMTVPDVEAMSARISSSWVIFISKKINTVLQ